MKKTWILIGSIGLIIVAAIAYVAFSGTKVSSPEGTVKPKETTAQTTPKPETPQNPVAAETKQPGKYESYNAETVANDTSRTILFFHAEWCPQCRQLDQNLKAGGIPDNISFYKVNYDTAGELRQKYGVTMQTTFVEIDGEGREVQKHVAYFEPTLTAVLREMGLK